VNIKEDFIKNTQKDFIDRLKRILADSFEGVEFFIFCVDVFGFRNINRVYGLEAGVLSISFFAKKCHFFLAVFNKGRGRDAHKEIQKKSKKLSYEVQNSCKLRKIMV
jgi:hypothetical protein